MEMKAIAKRRCQDLRRPPRHRLNIGGGRAAIGRWKQLIGDGLRSRMDERRVTEVNVAVDVLNRMPELGRPSYVRIV